MIRITKQYRTETGHRLHPYDGKCAHLHGHSYLWEVTVDARGRALEDGMVTDFGVVKKAMVDVLEPLDHCTVLGEQDPLVQVYTIFELELLLAASNGKKPRLKIVPFNPTAEMFCAWAASEITSHLPVDIRVAKVVVWETETSHATWEAQ